MADISKITLPSGSVYNIKDAQARSDIEDIRSSIAGGLSFLGETSTALTDGATTNPITINNKSVTAKSGDLVVYGQKEFLFNGTSWVEMGDLSLLGSLAYKSSASGSITPAGTVSKPTFTGTSSTVTITAADSNSGNYTPKGTVSQPTFTGTSSSVSITATDNTNGNYQPKGAVSQPTFSGNSLTSTGSFTPSGTVTPTIATPSSGETANYTPAGSVSAPSISKATAGSTTTVNSITDVGTLPTFSATVANENLTLGFSQGTLPKKGANTTVKTGDATYTASAPIFTGTGVLISASFSGTQDDISVSGTPSGTVSKPTFTGTKTQISGSVTPSGTVSQPTFTGTKTQISGSVTPSGTVSQPTFTGTTATVTVS